MRIFCFSIFTFLVLQTPAQSKNQSFESGNYNVMQGKVISQRSNSNTETIISQSPDLGAKLKEGSSTDIVISKPHKDDKNTFKKISTYINNKYPESSKKRNALFQIAQAINTIIANISTAPEELQLMVTSEYQGLLCLREVFGDDAGDIEHRAMQEILLSDWDILEYYLKTHDKYDQSRDEIFPPHCR